MDTELEDGSPGVTPFQLQILKAIPAANAESKKPVRCLPFFILRKILKIEGQRSIHNFSSSLKSLIYKGYLVRGEGELFCITDEGIRTARDAGAGSKPTLRQTSPHD